MDGSGLRRSFLIPSCCASEFVSSLEQISLFQSCRHDILFTAFLSHSVKMMTVRRDNFALGVSLIPSPLKGGNVAYAGSGHSPRMLATFAVAALHLERRLSSRAACIHCAGAAGRNSSRGASVSALAGCSSPCTLWQAAACRRIRTHTFTTRSSQKCLHVFFHPEH